MSGSQIVVTLTAPSGGTLYQGPSTAPSVTLSPSTGLTDLAGNPAASTSYTKSLTFF